MNPSLLCISFILALVSFPVEIRAKRVAKEEVKEDKKTDMNYDGTEEKLDDQVVKEEVEKDKKTEINSDVSEEELEDQELVVFKLYCTLRGSLLPYFQYLTATKYIYLFSRLVMVI